MVVPKSDGNWRLCNIFSNISLHGTFERLMDIICQYAATFLDNVVIHSTTWSDDLFHLRKVLREFWKAGMMANPKTCHLGLSEAEYLWYCIGRDLLKPQEKKRDVVKGYLQPTTKKQG